jgi:type I restriction enzyme, S subunit
MSSIVPDGWTLSTLCELATIKGGKRLPKGETFASAKTPFPYIRVTDFSHGSVALNDLRYVTDAVREKIKRYVISSDDLYISIAGTLGLVGEVPNQLNGALLTENAAKIIFNSKAISYKNFYKFYLNSDDVKEHFNQAKGTGGGVPKLALFRIEVTPVLAPPFPEQQKIAQILTSVDEVIEKTQAQIDKLKALKTAMMQELLTKGIGHVEFKDSPVGRIPVEWEAKRIGDVCKLQGGYAFKSIDARESGCRWLKIANVGKGEISWEGKSFLPDNYECIHKDFVLKENDIVVALTRPVLSGELKVAQLKTPDVPALLNQRVARAIPDEKQINKYFLYLLFSWKKMADEIEITIFGTDPPNVSTKQIESFVFSVPPLDEQVKISCAIGSVINKIEYLSKRLAGVKNTKKALMQDLLTGKVRVKTKQSNATLAVG